MKNNELNLLDQIMEIISAPGYKPITAKQLLPFCFDQSSQGFVRLLKALNSLEDDYIIMHDEMGRYDLIERMGYALGTIDIKENGYGFVTTPNYEVDYYVARENTKGAIFGDQVLIRTNRLDIKGPSAVVVKVTKRARQFLYGILQRKGKRWYVIPDDYRIKSEIRVHNDGNVKPKQMVKVFITNYDDFGLIRGEIVDVIGDANAPGVDITTAVLTAGFRTEFPKDVLDEVALIPDAVIADDILLRRDLRDKLIVTIDGDDAKDFDDGVSLTILPNGNYQLGVYIADVTHYVKMNKFVDLEAIDRSFSIYLPDRVYPMLPEKLSNGLCSLKPGEDRLVVGCEMEINLKGDVVSYDIFEGVINSKGRLTYDLVNDLFKTGITSYPEEHKTMLLQMNDLSKIIQQKRYDRGSLDFNVLEARVVLSKTGFVDDIVLRTRGDAEKLIEEFMILANETVAQAMEWLRVPFIYRIHENPKEEKITQFKAISRLLGYNIPKDGNQVHSKTLQKVLEASATEPHGMLLHNLMLRSMAKARYDGTNLGHYGLASKCYTHFTSPIRRYPDLLVHRLLKAFYFGFDENLQVDKYSHLVDTVSKTSSSQERLIEKLERDVVDMKKCEFMTNFIGDSFKGVISSVTPWGFYVELPNTIEGLVAAQNIGRDYYVYDEERLEWHGTSTKKRYRIGDQVLVVLLNASKERRQIDFMIKE